MTVETILHSSSSCPMGIPADPWLEITQEDPPPCARPPGFGAVLRLTCRIRPHSSWSCTSRRLL